MVIALEGRDCGCDLCLVVPSVGLLSLNSHRFDSGLIQKHWIICSLSVLSLEECGIYLHFTRSHSSRCTSCFYFKVQVGLTPTKTPGLSLARICGVHVWVLGSGNTCTGCTSGKEVDGYWSDREELLPMKPDTVLFFWWCNNVVVFHGARK